MDRLTLAIIALVLIFGAMIAVAAAPLVQGWLADRRWKAASRARDHFRRQQAADPVTEAQIRAALNSSEQVPPYGFDVHPRHSTSNSRKGLQRNG
jgi:siderophore synthetase component